MRAFRPWLGLLGTLALVGLAAPAGAQPVGSEFQVNTYTTGDQKTSFVGGHLVAADTGGNFAVVWRSDGQDGSLHGVFGQRYDNTGVALGSEFRVNSFTTDRQWYPSVAAADGGDFVVVWDGQGQGDSYDIFGQRYGSAGGPLGSEFRVNSYTTGAQRFASVATDASGAFVVVWSSYAQDGSSFGVFGQRYDSAGGPLGTEFRVNSLTSLNQVFASVASDASGHFVVVWESYRQDGSSYGIFGRRYDSAGGPLGSEFQVNSYTPGFQQRPSIASDANGDFVVVWVSVGQDGDERGVFGQRYDGAGQRLGAEFQVNSYTTGEQRSPSVASDASGDLVVTWQSFLQDGSNYGIVGQRYDSGGGLLGSEFQVNSYTTRMQRSPSVGHTGTNQFVVVWESYRQDGSGTGVFGQRLDFGGASTIHVGDLDRKAKNVGATWRAQVKTLVHDGNHVAESGVIVTFNVSGGVGIRSCTTVASGVCEVSVVVGDAVPTLTFTVTGLSKVAFSYVSGDNHDPDPDSNGTVIVVNQP